MKHATPQQWVDDQIEPSEEYSRALIEAREYAARNRAAIDAEWNALDGRTAAQKTRDEWRDMDLARKLELEREWDGLTKRECDALGRGL